MYIGNAQVDLHYNGFCNSVLWQLFHYVPLNMDSKLSETRTLQVQCSCHTGLHMTALPFMRVSNAAVNVKIRRPDPIIAATDETIALLQFQWAAHQSANQRFADVVLRNYSAGDVVWVQDYHLMLLPAMLKNRAPKMKVAHVKLSALAQDSKLPAIASYT